MKRYDLIVVGAGPAGLSAAIQAARYGVHVAVFDENAAPGGQLFKQIHKFFGSKEHHAKIRGFNIGKELLEEAEAAGVTVHLNSVVMGLYGNKEILVNSNGETAGFLQVDATINYALKLQGKDHSSFTTSLDSPYNTYLHKGLPAGPICSPSQSSIKAAIYPNQTDYYFYALGKDGVHHFFKTYAEHLNFINSSDYQSIG